MEKIDMRGLPSGLCIMLDMSSGGPSIQVEKPGEASNELNFNAIF